MATTNKSITGAWTLVVSLGADFMMSANSVVEFALTGADATAPTVSMGHVLQVGEGVTRSQTGAGAVWARAVGVPPATVVVT